MSFAVTASHAQTVDSVADKLTHFPMRLFGHIQSKTADLNQRLQRQTRKYLQELQSEEQRLEKRIYAIDSNSAKALFANSSQQYGHLLQKLQTDTGSAHFKPNGQYQPYTDCCKRRLLFSKRNPQVLGQSSSVSLQSPEIQAQLQSSVTSFVPSGEDAGRKSDQGRICNSASS